MKKKNKNELPNNYVNCDNSRVFGNVPLSGGHSVSPRYKTRKRNYQVFKESSLTVPDQSYTVRELFERAVVNSAPPNVERQAFYDTEQDIDKLFSRSGIDLSTLDLVEIEEYREQLNGYIDATKRSISDTRAKIASIQKGSVTSANE